MVVVVVVAVALGVSGSGSGWQILMKFYVILMTPFRYANILVTAY